jgi:hypothetical protein
VVKLMIRPNVQVQSIISALKTGDMEKKKKAIFGLRTQLQVCNTIDFQLH